MRMRVMIPNNVDLSVVQVNYAFDPALTDPDALLERYTTLTGWSEAVAAAGAAPVCVVQRFHRDADLCRNGLCYRFRGSRLAMHRQAVAQAPHVLHVNGLDFASESWFLRRQLPRGSTMIVQDHASGVPAAGGSPAQRAWLAVRRQAFAAADAFFFSTAAQARPWRELDLITADQPVYEVLEAGTRLQPLPRDEARAATATTGAPALLWVGRLNANKDPLTVLAAFEACLHTLPAATLTLIFSEDDLLPSVRARLDSNRNLAERVRLLGQVPHAQLAAYYSAADLFVLGSRHEGSGYALIEACTCGTIPVVTDIPPFRAITSNGEIGALWTPGAVDACADALLRVTAGDLVAMRRRVQEHAAHELSWRAIGTRALAAYRDVVARHGGRPS
jgi:glycosyltransferase involved in cell wall biosynthesis